MHESTNNNWIHTVVECRDFFLIKMPSVNVLALGKEVAGLKRGSTIARGRV